MYMGKLKRGATATVQVTSATTGTIGVSILKINRRDRIAEAQLLSVPGVGLLRAPGHVTLEPSGTRVGRRACTPGPDQGEGQVRRCRALLWNPHYDDPPIMPTGNDPEVCLSWSGVRVARSGSA